MASFRGHFCEALVARNLLVECTSAKPTTKRHCLFIFLSQKSLITNDVFS